MPTKVCKRCTEEKCLVEFGVDRHSKDGHSRYCKPCNVLARREVVARNPEQRKKTQRKADIKRWYGVTPECYDERMSLGYCEVCGDTHKLVYDHDHTTGAFRGVLCDRCNVALGSLRDDPVIIRRLAEYAEERTHGTVK